MIVTTTYLQHWAVAERKLVCPECGKSRVKKFRAYATISPFNRVTLSEVREQAAKSAEAEADRIAAKRPFCQWCEERGNREALIRYVDGAPIIEPDRYWSSPLHWLVDRKSIEQRYERGADGAYTMVGYFLTEKGIKRGTVLREQARKKGEYPFAAALAKVQAQ